MWLINIMPLSGNGNTLRFPKKKYLFFNRDETVFLGSVCITRVGLLLGVLANYQLVRVLVDQNRSSCN